jgi:hypothetical protein
VNERLRIGTSAPECERENKLRRRKANAAGNSMHRSLPLFRILCVYSDASLSEEDDSGKVIRIYIEHFLTRSFEFMWQCVAALDAACGKIGMETRAVRGEDFRQASWPPAIAGSTPSATSNVQDAARAESVHRFLCDER